MFASSKVEMILSSSCNLELLHLQIQLIFSVKFNVQLTFSRNQFYKINYTCSATATLRNGWTNQWSATPGKAEER